MPCYRPIEQRQAHTLVLSIVLGVGDQEVKLQVYTAQYIQHDKFINMFIFSLVVCSVCLLHGASNASLTRRPDNANLLVGDHLRLNCSTSINTGVAWGYVQPGSSSAAIMYSGGFMQPSFSSRYRVDATSLYDLVANVSDVAYCGTYTCYDNNGASGEGASAVVQVATKPECTLNDTEPRSNDSVSITCTMSYCNMSVDVPKFTSVNPLNATFSFDQQSYFIESLSVVKHIATLTGSALNLNGATIVYSYSPVPASSTMCPIVVVHYPAGNVSISPQRTAYSNGDIISCSADGVPSPVIYWTDAINNIVSRSSMLVVNGTDVQSLSPTNSVGSRTDSADSSSSKTSTTGTTSVTSRSPESSLFRCDMSELQSLKSATIALAVIAFVAMTVNILQLVYCLRRTKQEQHQPARHHSTDSQPADNYNLADISPYQQIDATRQIKPVYESLNVSEN